MTSKVLTKPDKICPMIFSLPYKYLGKPHSESRVTLLDLKIFTKSLGSLNESKLEKTLYSEPMVSLYKAIYFVMTSKATQITTAQKIEYKNILTDLADRGIC